MDSCQKIENIRRRWRKIKIFIKFSGNFQNVSMKHLVEKSINPPKKAKYVLHPKHRFSITWNVFMDFLYLISFIFTPIT
jgi:hypothetical protein